MVTKFAAFRTSSAPSWWCLGLPFLHSVLVVCPAAVGEGDMIDQTFRPHRSSTASNREFQSPFSPSTGYRRLWIPKVFDP